MENDLQIMSQLQLLIKQISSDISAIALIDHNNRIQWKYMLGNNNERYQHMVMKPGSGLAGQVIRFGRMIVIDQFHPITDKVRAQYPIMVSEQLLSAVVLPLKNEQQIFGVLLIGDRQSKAYSDIDIEYMEQTKHTLLSMLPRSFTHIAK